MSKVLDFITWLLFGISLIISILTMLVLFGGIQYIELFSTLLPLEISLSSTFIIWGFNSIKNPYTRNSKNSPSILIVLGIMLLVFALFGIY